MFTTGYEEHSELDENRKLIVHRRKMTKGSELYDKAILASHFAKLDCEERKIQTPEWGWFGIQSSASKGEKEWMTWS